MSRRRTGRAASASVAVGIAGAFTLCVPPAHAWDQTAYLLNVFLRPGYNFANAEEALAYGYAICDKIERGESYTQLVSGVKANIGTADDYQASYLISQAANELCPNLIGQLRKSAQHEVP